MTVTVDEEKLEEGLFVLPSDQRWRKLDFSGKEVMEFETMVEEEGQQVKVTVALLVNSISEDENGELMAYGRFVGCDREEVSKAFSNDINRKNLPIHMCQKDPCDGLHLIVGAHVLRARWFQVGNFAAAYMKTWGMMVLKEAENGPAGGKPKASPKRRAPPGRQPFKPRQDSKNPGSTRRRTSPKTPGGGVKERKNPDEEGKGTGDATRAALRGKLSALKDRLLRNNEWQESKGGKGKGGKGKNGKQKGKGRGGGWNQYGDWNKNNWWRDQQENKDSKDSKTEKDGKKEK